MDITIPEETEYLVSSLEEYVSSGGEEKEIEKKIIINLGKDIKLNISLVLQEISKKKSPLNSFNEKTLVNLFSEQLIQLQCFISRNIWKWCRYNLNDSFEYMGKTWIDRMVKKFEQKRGNILRIASHRCVATYQEKSLSLNFKEKQISVIDEKKYKMPQIYRKNLNLDENEYKRLVKEIAENMDSFDIESLKKTTYALINTFLYRYKNITLPGSSLKSFLESNPHYKYDSYIIYDFNILRKIQKNNYLEEETLKKSTMEAFTCIYYVLKKKDLLQSEFEINFEKELLLDETNHVLESLVHYFEKKSKSKILVDETTSSRPQLQKLNGVYSVYSEGIFITSSVDLLDSLIIWMILFDLINYKCISRCFYDVFKLVVFNENGTSIHESLVLKNIVSYLEEFKDDCFIKNNFPYDVESLLNKSVTPSVLKLPKISFLANSSKKSNENKTKNDKKEKSKGKKVQKKKSSVLVCIKCKAKGKYICADCGKPVCGNKKCISSNKKGKVCCFCKDVSDSSDDDVESDN